MSTSSFAGLGGAVIPKGLRAAASIAAMQLPVRRSAVDMGGHILYLILEPTNRNPALVFAFRSGYL